MRVGWLPLVLCCAACGSEPLDREAGPSLQFETVPSWPVLPEGVVLGPVAGVAVDSHDRVYLFHRADADFDNEDPIALPTVLVVEGASGGVVAHWGAGQFIVPHGISIDARDHVWLTDTGANAVFEATTDGEIVRAIDGT